MFNKHRRCLLLSPYTFDGSRQAEKVCDTLRRYSFDIQTSMLPLEYDRVADYNPTLIVSYGYRHRIPREVWASWDTLNLHISALPWNRGADPNLWSWIDDTPKGVSMHWVDDGFDTGPVVQSWHVPLDRERDTLASSYGKLHHWLADMFDACLYTILDGYPDAVRGTPQLAGSGSTHTTKDRQRIEHLLAAEGWETPVRNLINAKYR